MVVFSGERPQKTRNGGMYVDHVGMSLGPCCQPLMNRVYVIHPVTSSAFGKAHDDDTPSLGMSASRL